MENNDIEDGIFDRLKVSLIDVVNDSAEYDVRSRTRFTLWSNTMDVVQNSIAGSIWNSIRNNIEK